MGLGNLINRARQAATSAAGYRERLITNREADQAWKIFRDTVPYRYVFVSNGLGGQQRAYTIPHPAIWGHYLIHIGPTGYEDCLRVEFTFIHELMHVWQGHNNLFAAGYVFKSVWHQATQGSAAYSYTPGNEWRSYNVEQQAQLVEDWWRMGGRENDNDPRWRYIRDNVRGLQR
jgi:hypothetical protein